jgi:hypothetical protein
MCGTETSRFGHDGVTCVRVKLLPMTTGNTGQMADSGMKSLESSNGGRPGGVAPFEVREAQTLGFTGSLACSPVRSNSLLERPRQSR